MGKNKRLGEETLGKEQQINTLCTSRAIAKRDTQGPSSSKKVNQYMRVAYMYHNHKKCKIKKKKKNTEPQQHKTDKIA